MRLVVAMSGFFLISSPALATNGMNMEGYGPIAMGMGGASMAYDNGSAAVMNNPATIGLMAEGSRLDLAIGGLFVDITSSNSFGAADSEADRFSMPGVGWVRKRGIYSYGVGVYAQGGMGTQYAAGSVLDPSVYGSFFGTTPLEQGFQQRSEVGVGRIVFPFAVNTSPRLTVGGSLDYIRGGMDVLWTMDATGFLGGIDTSTLSPLNQGKLSGSGITPANNRAYISGSMVDTFLDNFGTAFTGFGWGRFAFSNSSDFSQITMGEGYAGKLGLTWQMNERLTVGAAYHSRTHMDDFTGPVTVSFNVETAGGNVTVPVPGQVRIVNFQWPETYAVGLAYTPNDKWLVAADLKIINWSRVMRDFNMVITADSDLSGMAAGFAGTVLDFRYPQNWRDQTVLSAGVAHQYDDRWTLRAGLNLAENPVPDAYVSALFPAIIEQHYTAGVGYRFASGSSLDFALSYAPRVTVTEAQVESTGGLATQDYPATTISHGQINWQVMYSLYF